MEDENIKKAFQKVKEDILYLSDSIRNINEHIIFLHGQLAEISSLIKELKSNQSIQNNQKISSTDLINPADRQTAESNTSTDNPAHNLAFKSLKEPDYIISIGNEGVPADRQTDRQTDQQTHSELKLNSKTNNYLVENASQLLDSLDAIKKDLRRKFKQITDQEFLVFSTIYQLEDSKQHSIIDYSLLATTLNLTESSIRDYIARLIKKDIPIKKIKVNNKKINLIISSNLRKIASLPTILALRELQN